MRTKCIRYFVDPRLLSEGVSVENLPRENEEEYVPDPERQAKLNPWRSTKNSDLFDNPKTKKRGQSNNSRA